MRASLEMESYPPAQDESAHPLLHPPSSPSPQPRRHHRRARYLRPLLLLGTPLLLLALYAALHPLVPALPPLPKVHLDSGASTDCSCGATPEGARLCETYHPEGLRASRLVEGSGARVRRLLDRARKGDDVKIGVLGGSVSACRGVHPSPEYPEGDPNGPGCYPQLLRDWFAGAFPKSSVEVMNGAIGGMDSSYYAFCGTHHIDPDVDLIVLEFDVNDQPDAVFQTFFDQLLRVLLEFRSQPAIVILGAWAPQVAQDVGYGDPQIVHLPLAHYYDIPYISLKRLIFNHYTRFPESTAQTFWLPDYLHPNARGHRLLSDLLAAYFETQLCLLDKHGLPPAPEKADTIATGGDARSLVDVTFEFPGPSHTAPDGAIDPDKPPEGWEESFDRDKLAAIGKERRHFALPTTPYALPPVGMFTPMELVIDPHRPDPTDADHILELVQPSLFCADANDRKHPMAPTVHDGWEKFVWNGEKHYWVSSTVGARIRVEIKVNAGRVAVYYFRSQHYDLGDAQCWVDDNEAGAVSLAGYWTKQYNTAVVAYIDRNVTVGDHYVTCEVANTTSHPHNPDAHHFRIVAVMAT
ncbi:hypothetical protein Q8F55_003110 [Vanrija albida]|uniref:SGNH hydrolase-type esterase domain-containing protein n=1 Tax=Vanrija albida TaxID=181172 RepID=A0ABR3QCL7_9TREE